MSDETNPLLPIVSKIDHAIVQSRLNLLAVMMRTDMSERLARIVAVIAKLKPGSYLIGTGPSTVGIIPLSVDEVVLGRFATPVEKPSEVVVDYLVSDTMYLGPHEVSRAHAKVILRPGPPVQYILVDMNSTCGTYVNGKAVDASMGCVLANGDVISLGSSCVSTFVFLQVHHDAPHGKD